MLEPWKVILETGELRSPELIAKAAMDAFQNGADFIKTSTGKTETGATLDAARVMLQVICDLQSRDAGTPVQRGLKVSGGVRTYDDAISYMNLVEEMLPQGSEFLRPCTFRFGVSGLLTSLLKDEAADSMAPADCGKDSVPSASDTAY